MVCRELEVNAAFASSLKIELGPSHFPSACVCLLSRTKAKREIQESKNTTQYQYQFASLALSFPFCFLFIPSSLGYYSICPPPHTTLLSLVGYRTSPSSLLTLHPPTLLLPLLLLHATLHT